MCRPKINSHAIAKDEILIQPLRKIDPKTERPYDRQQHQQSLQDLYGLPIEKVAERAKIMDSGDPEYITSECIIHFVRQSKANGDSSAYESLFLTLRARIAKAVPVRSRRVRGVSGPAELDSEAQIQELVLYRFQKLLCLDREEYDDRLDFYECRFNAAIFTLRSTARRDIRKKENRRARLSGGEVGPDDELDEILATANPHKMRKNGDLLYRLSILEAINSLPLDEKRVVELLIEGFPITSKDPTMQTIAKLLKCSPKTVQLRRYRAKAWIEAALKAEEVA